MEVLQKRFCRRNESIASLCGIDCSAFPSEGFSDELDLPMTSFASRLSSGRSGVKIVGAPLKEIWRASRSTMSIS